jgi:demethylmenaquinone methyltransferase/2-methoxy-6-polyprenyl-1,4-benzoquinol methylase
MFSYVFMKILEGRPRSYDRRMDELSRGRVRAMKQAVAGEIPPGTHVLEVGCGTGELAALICARGATAEAFDRSPSMLDMATRRIEEEGLDGRLTLREMGVDGMDELEEQSYGAVVSTLVLSELTDDERRYALKHAFRVLEPGGLLVTADEVLPRSRAGQLLHAFARVPMLAATYLVSGASTRPIPDLRGEVLDAGFTVEKEQRSHGDAFAVLVAHRPAQENTA